MDISETERDEQERQWIFNSNRMDIAKEKLFAWLLIVMEREKKEPDPKQKEFFSKQFMEIHKEYREFYCIDDKSLDKLIDKIYQEYAPQVRAHLAAN